MRSGDSGAPWRGIDPTSRGRHWQPPSLMYDLYEELTGESLSKVATMQERLDQLDSQSLVTGARRPMACPRIQLVTVPDLMQGRRA